MTMYLYEYTKLHVNRDSLVSKAVYIYYDALPSKQVGVLLHCLVLTDSV